MQKFCTRLAGNVFSLTLSIVFELCVLIAGEILLLVGLVSVGQKILLIIIKKSTI